MLNSRNGTHLVLNFDEVDKRWEGKVDTLKEKVSWDHFKNICG